MGSRAVSVSTFPFSVSHLKGDQGALSDVHALSWAMPTSSPPSAFMASRTALLVGFVPDATSAE